jgi:hypothetical protein
MLHVHTRRFGSLFGVGPGVRTAGPIDRKAVRLIKLALAMGASSEGAVHSHVRRGLGEGNLEGGNQAGRAIGHSNPWLSTSSPRPHVD